MTSPWITMPRMDRPAVIFDELMEEIRSGILDHPRSQQKTIGPSGIGEPCTRALLHSLAAVSGRDRGAQWKPTVGTAIHSWLEAVFAASPAQFVNPGSPRYLLEQRVRVGQINGVDVYGSCDLFDTGSCTVVDWKTKGKGTLEDHRRKGPGEQYRIQAHLYGRGMQQAGLPVKTVMIVFLPRDGQLSQMFYWAEPYDEQVAIAALTRATGLSQLTGALGMTGALSLFPTLCTNEWCDWCGPAKRAAQPAVQRNHADPFGFDDQRQGAAA